MIEIRRSGKDDASAGFVKLVLDATNVFEDSPTAVVIAVGGPPFGADGEQQITCGPVAFTLAPVDADATFCLKLSEAEQLRDGLTALLAEARDPNLQSGPTA